MPRPKSGTIAAVPARVPRPRERAQTVPTPEALEFELLEELKRKNSDSPPADDGPTIEITEDTPPRVVQQSAPALEILQKAAPTLEMEQSIFDWDDDAEDALPGVLDPGRIPTIAAKAEKTVAEFDGDELEEPTLPRFTHRGPDAPPRSSREPAYIEPSVVVTDEASRSDHVAPSIARQDEISTERPPPPEEAGLRQQPTIPPERKTRPKRRHWRLAVLALLVAGVVAGYFRFPKHYQHGWQVTSSHASTWGAAVERELTQKGWL